MKIYSHRFSEFSNDFNKWKEEFLAIKNQESNTQWKEGRSAWSLAWFMCKDNGEQRITEYVNEILLHLNDSIDHFDLGVIEHENKFDEFRGNGRIQDLAIWGKTKKGRRIYIAVEAKVDETFGKTISEELRDAEKYKNNGHPATKRIERITRLRNDYLVGIDSDSLRYQLLYYLAGTIKEPFIQLDEDISIMLVLVFKTKLYDKQKGKSNKKDFDDFMKIVGEQREYGYDLSKIKPNTYACYIEI